MRWAEFPFYRIIQLIKLTINGSLRKSLREDLGSRAAHNIETAFQGEYSPSRSWKLLYEESIGPRVYLEHANLYSP